ncbi:MAG: cytosine permease [Bacillota bacterium]
MPEETKTELFKDYEREPVPEHLRRGWFQMGMVWVGIGVCIAALMLGGILGAGLSLGQAIIAAVLGSLVLTAISALCSVVGAHTHLSTAMISKFAFGEKGSYLVSMVLALGCYGWFGVQTGLFGETAFVVVEKLTGVTVSTGVLVFLGGLLMTSTAVFGYRAIAKLSVTAIPLVGALMFASLIVVLRDHPFGTLWAMGPVGTPMSLGFATSIVAGSFMVGAVIGPDISRYARTPRDAALSSVLGFLIGFSIVLFLGATFAKATGESDVVKVMLALGWGLPAMLVLIFAQWTTNDNNLYSAALGFSLIFKKQPKWQLTIVAGVLGTILAMWGIYGRFIQWLVILSALVPPIGGVYVSDYFFFSRRAYHFDKVSGVPAIRWEAIISWVIAALVGFSTTPKPGGFGLFTLTTVSALDSFLAAVLCQLILVPIFAKSRAALVKPGA